MNSLLKLKLLSAPLLLVAAISQALSARADYIPIFTPPNALTHPGNLELVPYYFPTYQQIFDASLFSAIPAGGGRIRGLNFRASVSSGQVEGMLTGIIVEFSTTTRTVDSLSPIFSENLGLDNQVYWAGQTTSFTAGHNAQGEQTWGLHFPVAPGKGFAYDPAKGNLLMTIHNLYVPTDQHRIGLDGIRGSALTASVQSENANAISGIVSSDALVVWLAMFELVPEPSSLLLLGLASGFGWKLLRTNSSRKERDVAI